MVDRKLKEIKKKKKSTSKSKNKSAQRVPSKHIGPAIFKYDNKSFIHVDLVRGVKVDREKDETDKELEKRTVRECYTALKQMQADYKQKAKELGFRVK